MNGIKTERGNLACPLPLAPASLQPRPLRAHKTNISPSRKARPPPPTDFRSPSPLSPTSPNTPLRKIPTQSDQIRPNQTPLLKFRYPSSPQPAPNIPPHNRPIPQPSFRALSTLCSNARQTPPQRAKPRHPPPTPILQNEATCHSGRWLRPITQSTPTAPTPTASTHSPPQPPSPVPC
jgi:hypothetical protein